MTLTETATATAAETALGDRIVAYLTEQVTAYRADLNRRASKSRASSVWGWLPPCSSPWRFDGAVAGVDAADAVSDKAAWCDSLEVGSRRDAGRGWASPMSI